MWNTSIDQDVPVRQVCPDRSLAACKVEKAKWTSRIQSDLSAFTEPRMYWMRCGIKMPRLSGLYGYAQYLFICLRLLLFRGSSPRSEAADHEQSSLADRQAGGVAETVLSVELWQAARR